MARAKILIGGWKEKMPDTQPLQLTGPSRISREHTIALVALEGTDCFPIHLFSCRILIY